MPIPRGQLDDAGREARRNRIKKRRAGKKGNVELNVDPPKPNPGKMPPQGDSPIDPLDGPLGPPTKEPPRDFTGAVTGRPAPGGFDTWDQYNQWRQDLRGGKGGQPTPGIMPPVIGPGPRPIGPPVLEDGGPIRPFPGPGIRPDMLGPPLVSGGGGGFDIQPLPPITPGIQTFPGGVGPGPAVMPPQLANLLGINPGGIYPPVQPQQLPPQAFPFMPQVAPGINPQQQFNQLLMQRLGGY